MKKRLLSTLLVLCVLSSSFCTSALADNETQAAVSVWVDGTEITSVKIAGDPHLFLPASADIEQLFLCFASGGSEMEHVQLTGEYGTASADGPVDVTKLGYQNPYGAYVVYCEGKGMARTRLCVMQGANIASMYLHSANETEGRAWVDSSKKNEATGSMELVTADGETIYAGGLTQIKGRGNSTFGYYPKKPYQIKLENKADLLGTGEKIKTWVLLANYADATMMHDKLLKDMAAQLGMDYVASCDWVNLYYDGEYRGVYLLTEKNTVDETSIDITDMEKAYESLNPSYGNDMEAGEGYNRYNAEYHYVENIAEPAEQTGGWLIEKNLNFIDETCGFFTTRDAGYNVKSPEFVGKEGMEYISEYIQAFEDAVYATDAGGNYTGYNAETGKYFYEYVDMESLVRLFLIQEFSVNGDGFASSTYFYKDVNGIMYVGPLWDQDMTFGTNWVVPVTSTTVYRPYISDILIRIPAFREAVEEYFTEAFEPLVMEYIAEGGTVDRYIQTLKPNAAMNYLLWPYVQVGDPAKYNHFWPSGTDYSSVTEHLETWMRERLDFIRPMYRLSETGGPEEPEAPAFSDVPKGHWAAEAVAFATSRGLFNGVSAELFAPSGTATRGMIFTVLARMDGQNTTPAEGEHWQQPGLDWAVENRISDGSAPDSPVTREQLATLLYRYVGSPAAEGSLDGFRDGADTSSWAQDAMRWAVSQGIFRGDDEGRLNPKGTATRAEIAQVIMNFMTMRN